ncbi:MAG: carboxypeptidase regulatory-like domain-containing protein [Gemmatimonadaceae bacterium]|nr:carboxypeptidase regulatory-like domain-containing protein [Gemmatimonadaceae bacterium]
MRFLTLLFVVLVARAGVSQPSVVSARAPGAVVSGIVRDSIARGPLAGAMVQLVAADSQARGGRMAVADSLGRYALADVPNGRYTVGFFHPMLDSLGLEPPLREVFVDNGLPVRVDLGIPSPARLRAAICAAPSTPLSGAVVIGVVRDAQDRAPVAGATVTGEWLELSFRREGLARRIPRLVVTTGENGWFAICDLPSAGMIALRASRGGDSTDLIEVQVPTHGLLRRELYLGYARHAPTAGTTRPADSIDPPRRDALSGDVRLSGIVLTADGGGPIVGAQVSMVSGSRTRTNERGEFTLLNAPAGTRTLEVRALSFYPERRAVDVIADGPLIRVALSTLKAVLDTVRVTASRPADRMRSGFLERRRSGVGRFLTQEDIRRRHPIVTSDIFRTVSGVRVQYDADRFDSRILMRGAVDGWCAPVIYIDGRQMNTLSADEIDTWMRPDDIVGIEVYAGAGMPAQFEQGMSACGTIVIWTR